MASSTRQRRPPRGGEGRKPRCARRDGAPRRNRSAEDVPEGSAVVEVRSAGVNPSDVKAVLGAMPHAVWPRTPGRDYAGVVVEGPKDLVGREVWGSGGELGIRRDGTHAQRLVLPAANLREKPATITLAEAGAIGVPFITAFTGLREAGPVQRGDVVLVLGANGKVGQAAIQLATAAGARVFGVERTPEPYRGHATGEVTMLGRLGGRHRRAGARGHWRPWRRHRLQHGRQPVFRGGQPRHGDGRTADLHLDDRALGSLRHLRLLPRPTPLHRRRHACPGQRGRRGGAGALRPGFESGALRPFPVLAANVYPLARAAEAYRAVLAGAPERVVLDPTL